jgi:Gas vesicle synthesis protein GvpO
VADLSDAQRKRAQARQRRRKSEPEQENGDSAAADTAPEQEDSHHAVRQAAKVAAAAGAAGAVAAAARALANQHHDGDGEDDHEAADQAEQQQPEQAEQPQPEARREEPEPELEADGRDDEPIDGASPSDARRALDRGRSQLEDLLGRPVESVSALERTHDGWVLALEVVEVKRIPETTDVLASYELELDDGLDLRRYQQVRRYHRAQAELGEGS